MPNNASIALQGFAERKVLLLLEVIQTCRNHHAEAAWRMKASASSQIYSAFRWDCPEMGMSRLPAGKLHEYMELLLDLFP